MSLLRSSLPAVMWWQPLARLLFKQRYEMLARPCEAESMASPTGGGRPSTAMGRSGNDFQVWGFETLEIDSRFEGPKNLPCAGRVGVCGGLHLVSASTCKRQLLNRIISHKIEFNLHVHVALPISECTILQMSTHVPTVHYNNTKQKKTF